MIRMSKTTAYLDTLNSEQRRAVEHGVTELDCTSGGPLLVIAGAGSGKTNTLAHRVARLIVKGAEASIPFTSRLCWSSLLASQLPANHNRSAMER
jgi:superfamily I DNA and RNA helicase